MPEGFQVDEKELKSRTKAIVSSMTKSASASTRTFSSSSRRA
jgi:hypothetical protein